MAVNSLTLSVVVPVHNEEENLPNVVDELRDTLNRERIPFELVLVNDNSTDGSRGVIEGMMAADERIRTVNRRPPGGFGRAIRSGLDAVKGDIVVICMADCSDDPEDVVAYYRTIEEGYDCVFGSRFIKGSVVRNYPRFKLVCNRVVNKMVQLLFRCPYNDMTNAFKAYRTEVIRDLGQLQASHFNITLELSLGVWNRNYKIAQVPIRWYGRTWGSSKLRLREMGRRYLATLLKMGVDRTLILDDIRAEQQAGKLQNQTATSEPCEATSAA
ncbi:Undecaprenyl-phosphate mannosyltransferase [Planctomycetes bacterium Pan216]|uniref:Undecaprenyl-phosphate mannosyltransferase n=1 Tax=Kolteria novifilia TaxID=2527975 RepID=A0A518BAA4_9BACT|nr:Undecaprenyl-phosphate mannosyltransferase [Planctomycetes bacterium Pan216]